MDGHRPRLQARRRLRWGRSTDADGDWDGRQLRPQIPCTRRLDNRFFIDEAVYCTDRNSGLLFGFSALTLLSAAVCALVWFLLARRYAFSRAERIGWALCGFMFGWVGLMLMLALQEWPARVRCPACGQPRRVDRDRCDHCGAPHVPPAPDGTEIFDKTATTSQAALAGR